MNINLDVEIDESSIKEDIEGEILRRFTEEIFWKIKNDITSENIKKIRKVTKEIINRVVKEIEKDKEEIIKSAKKSIIKDCKELSKIMVAGE